MAILTSVYLKLLYDPKLVDSLVDDGDGPDDAILTQVMSTADGIIQNHLCNMYTLAQLSADEDVKRLAAAIAMRLLEGRRLKVSPQNDADFLNCLEQLQRYRDGELRLSAVPSVLPRIKPTELVNVYEQSGLFEGMIDPED